jgi:predicted DNA-binding protein
MPNKKTQTKISVLLADVEYERLDAYCRDRGYKKSTLVARLIRQYLDMEGYGGSAPAPFGRGGRPSSR